MALIKCNSCGNDIPDNAKFCPHCGAKTDNGIESTEFSNEEGSVVDSKGFSTKRKVVTFIVVLFIAGIASFLLNEQLIKSTVSDNATRETVATTETTVSESNDVNEAEESVPAKTKYVYEFTLDNGSMVDATTQRITIDTEEGTAQLTSDVLDDYGSVTSEKANYYGSCERVYDNPDVILTGGFSGAGDENYHIKGETLNWSSYQYVDTKNNFLYINSSSYKAKNPDYRIKLTPIE